MDSWSELLITIHARSESPIKSESPIIAKIAIPVNSDSHSFRRYFLLSQTAHGYIGIPKNDESISNILDKVVNAKSIPQCNASFSARGDLNGYCVLHVESDVYNIDQIVDKNKSGFLPLKIIKESNPWTLDKVPMQFLEVEASMDVGEIIERIANVCNLWDSKFSSAKSRFYLVTDGVEKELKKNEKPNLKLHSMGDKSIPSIFYLLKTASDRDSESMKDDMFVRRPSVTSVENRNSIYKYKRKSQSSAGSQIRSKEEIFSQSDTGIARPLSQGESEETDGTVIVEKFKESNSKITSILDKLQQTLSPMSPQSPSPLFSSPSSMKSSEIPDQIIANILGEQGGELISSLSPIQVSDLFRQSLIESASKNMALQENEGKHLEKIKALEAEIESFSKATEKSSKLLETCENEKKEILMQNFSLKEHNIKLESKVKELENMICDLERKISFLESKESSSICSSKSDGSGSRAELKPSLKKLSASNDAHLSSSAISEAETLVGSPLDSSSTSPLCYRADRKIRFDPLIVFLDASLEGDLEQVKELIEKGTVSVNSCNDEGITALHCAACNGHLEILKFLLEKGAEVNVVDIDGWTPLHGATCLGDVSVVTLLISHGADVHVINNDNEKAIDLAENPSVADILKQAMSHKECSEIVNALYNFDSENVQDAEGDELDFGKNDKLKIISREDPIWWLAEFNGKQGFIPSSFVQ